MRMHAYILLSGLKHAFEQIRVWQSGLMQPTSAGPCFLHGGTNRALDMVRVTANVNGNVVPALVWACVACAPPRWAKGGVQYSRWTLQRAAYVLNVMLPCPACR